MAQVVEILIMENESLHSQHTCSSRPCYAQSQGINSHDIDPILKKQKG